MINWQLTFYVKHHKSHQNIVIENLTNLHISVPEKILACLHNVSIVQTATRPILHLDKDTLTAAP